VFFILVCTQLLRLQNRVVENWATRMLFDRAQYHVLQKSLAVHGIDDDDDDDDDR
jgi:hypothetical protein